MNPIVTIVSMTYNRKHLSTDYLPKALSKVGDIPHEVLIWDNGNDGTYEWFKEYAQVNKSVRKVVHAGINVGTQAINTLAAFGRGKYLLKLDDDMDVPENFAVRLVDAFEASNDARMFLLGWDMAWKSKTFATRPAIDKATYLEPLGRTVKVTEEDSVLIYYNDPLGMINGACRLCPRQEYITKEIQPKNILYGADELICSRVKDLGYGYGFLHSRTDRVIHRGTNDTPEYRAYKDAEMLRNNCTRDW